MTSISARIFNGVLPFIGSRKMAPEAINAPARSNTVNQMKRSLKKYSAQEEDILGHKTITFSAPNPVPSLHIIYLHGGAYVWQGAIIHWNFINKLLGALNCRVTYFDYPLAPENTYLDTFKMLQMGFDHLVKKYPCDNFVLMGDSSGGGLALAFAQKLSKEKYPIQPKELILLSPWLDLALDNPGIPAIEKLDRLLKVNSLRAAGYLFAGKKDVSEYLLSPINGDISKLGSITLFIGTHDILWPDCIKFREKALRTGANLSFFEYREMPHTWMLFPISEARDAFDQIKGNLRKYQDS